MTRLVSRRALAGAALAAPAAACATVLDIQESFDWTWRAHVAAVQARDLARLESTLTPGDTLILILQNGALTTTKSEYVAFHRDWFTSLSWRIAYEPRWTRQSTTMAQVLLGVTYEDVRAGGASIATRSHLILSFEREAAGWKLIADQNTHVPA